VPPLPQGVAFGAEYDIVLLLDNREQFSHAVSGGRAQALEQGVRRLQQRGVVVETRSLPIGDALWVARCRRPPHADFCLDVVVERKRVDDLEASIKDRRYKSQKYWLKRCGLRRPIYLLEGDPNAGGAGGGSAGAGGDWRAKAVKSALMSTEVVDGFQVLRTPDAHGTFDLYGRLTVSLRELYTTRVGAARGEGLARAAGTVEAAVQPECPTYQAFCDAVAAAKLENKTVRAMWGLMLTHVPGVGGEVAEAVLWEHPTASSLAAAYAAAGGQEAQKGLLAPLKTSAIKTVGPVLSQRIWAFFHQDA
jgi:crossover junction endonuclease MUS81